VNVTRRFRRRQHGFSFLEMVVALAVLAAIVAFLAPTLLTSVSASREDATLAEMAQIYESIMGDQRQNFGYVGDVGTYPTSLEHLAITNGATGWRGPYFGNARLTNGLLTDPYGQPYEYYLVSGVSGSDRLAIVSRGPDGVSTNGAMNPNVALNFSGTPPTDGAYFTGTNADNIVYPTPSTSNVNALNSNITGTVALNIQNFDSNPLVNAFVPACPNLYRVTVTSQSRGTAEVSNLGYAPGFQVDLPQGVYQVLVTAQNLSAAPFNEKLTVIPGQTLTRSPNITGLDSSGTDQFVLTVTNKQPSETLRVYQFATLLAPASGSSPIPANGGTSTFSVRACSQVFIKSGTTTAIRDQVVMPWSAVTKIVGGASSTLAVTNNRNETIRLFNSDIFFGEVRKGKSQTFTVGLLAGDVVQSRTTGGTVLTTMTLVSGANSLTQN
jgi:prepilin-type N-terminal cleavage/methylation domain-containing protein